MTVPLDAVMYETAAGAGERRCGSTPPGRRALGGPARRASAHPQKWRKVPLNLGEFTLDPDDGTSRSAAADAFAAHVSATLDATLSAWLATEEGQRDAYRPGERILPSQFATRDSWDTYLAALRTRRPATLGDVRPELRRRAGTSESGFEGDRGRR